MTQTRPWLGSDTSLVDTPPPCRSLPPDAVTMSRPHGACQHIVSDGKALGRDDEGDDDLDAVAALVAGVAEAADVRGILGWFAFEVGACQIIEKHIEFHIEEGPPTLGEIVEKRRLVD